MMFQQYLLSFAFLSCFSGQSLQWDSGHQFCHNYMGDSKCISCDRLEDRDKCDILEKIIPPPVAPLAPSRQMHGMQNPAYGMHGIPNPAYGMPNPAHGMPCPAYGMPNPAPPSMVVNNGPINCSPSKCNPCNCNPPCFEQQTAATGECPGGGPAISLVLTAVTLSLLGVLTVHGMLVLPV